jgi:hypothetical protein
MYTIPELPTSIDGVITQLEEIILWSEKNRSRMGYFAALYKRVTVNVKEKIEAGYFDDNQRMERLDVVFANRYLKAFYDFQEGKPCSASWELAFKATKKWKPLVLQHLFGGMNAHIGLDLGIAAATVQPTNIESLKGDFDKINEVLASLVEEVQNELADIWPLLRPIDAIAGKLDEEIANFAMGIARDAAWEVALAYSQLNTPERQQEYIVERDKKVAAFGIKIYKPGWILRALLFLFRLGELGNVRSKIGKLNRET